MAFEAGQVRRSQMVQIYGPGSIINLKYGEATVSALMCELGTWKDTPITMHQKFYDERLSKRIKSKYRVDNQPMQIDWFKLPPIEPDPKNRWEHRKSNLLGKIFPQTFICPSCRRIGMMEEPWVHDSEMQGDIRRHCQTCTGHAINDPTYLVPSRFIVACEAGHLQEFPYRIWLEKKGKGGSTKCKHPSMTLKQGKGLSLSEYWLRCVDDQRKEVEGCGRYANMRSIFAEGSLPVKCDGESPWLMDYEDHTIDCKCMPKTIQRNSQSVWTAITESALTIPPWDNKLKNTLDNWWTQITIYSERDDRANFIKTVFPNIVNDAEQKGMSMDYSADELISRVEKEIKKDKSASEDLKQDEYKALTEYAKHMEIDDFQVRPEVIPEDPRVKKLIASVLSVERLREVRALVKFTRMNKKMDKDTIFCDLTNDKYIKWLPVLEVFGEGIFIELNKNVINDYLESSELRKNIKSFYKQSLTEEVTKRILFHTFSHLFMKAVSVESGYSLASIAERIYCEKDQYGILIYTASNDSEGTLGGLSRLAKKERLEPIILNALEFSTLCSNDPLCSDGALSAHDPTNGAACHSCMLIPETSCEDYNSNLSRTIVEQLYYGL